MVKHTPGMFCEKGLLKNFTKFTEKHLCRSLIFNKVAGRRSTTLLKRGIQRSSFPVMFATLSKTPFLENTSRRLLLRYYVIKIFIKIDLLSNLCQNLQLKTGLPF